MQLFENMATARVTADEIGSMLTRKVHVTWVACVGESARELGFDPHQTYPKIRLVSESNSWTRTM